MNFIFTKDSKLTCSVVPVFGGQCVLAPEIAGQKNKNRLEENS